MVDRRRLSPTGAGCCNAHPGANRLHRAEPERTSAGTSLLTALIRSALQFAAFYGLGLALHQQLQRHEVGYIILAIWLFQAFFSAWWMKRYRFGPMEWLWRSLTYWQRQPLKRLPGRPSTDTRGQAAG